MTKSGRIRGHIRSNVIGYAALFIALGGTAYAANTVGSSDIIDNSVQSVDLKDNAAVEAGDVVNDTVAGGGLTKADLRTSSVTGTEILNDTVTPADIASLTTLKSSGRVDVNDPVGGGPTTQTLLSAGPFTFTGICTDNGAGFHQAVLRISSSVSGWSGPGATNQAAGFVDFLDSTNTNTATWNSGGYQATAAGIAFGGTYGAGVNHDTGDCTFALQAVG